jgi:hypothetical protein
MRNGSKTDATAAAAERPRQRVAVDAVGAILAERRSLSL